MENGANGMDNIPFFDYPSIMPSKVAERRPEGFPGQRLVVVPPPIAAHGLNLPVCSHLLPTHIGRFDAAKNHFVERKSGTPEHILILCLNGRGFVRTRGKTHPIGQGDAFLLPPGERHTYFADDADPWTKVWVHFTGSGAPDYAKMLLGPGRGPVFHLRDMEVLIEAFEETFRHVLGGYTDNDLIGLSTSCARLLGLCRLHRQARTGRRRDGAERILRTIRFMRENLDRPVSLGELAKISGWAPSHLSALFRTQTNTTPLVFLTRLRLQRACELLKNTGDSVAQIAAATGYDDPFYFSRLFSQHQGLSPSAYRQTYSLNTSPAPHHD